MKKSEKLKENYPDLVTEYSEMTKDELLEQICAEVLDLYAMEDRVQTFMNECTMNLSKTNYTPEAIKGMINEKQENDINQFCADLLENFDTEDEIIQDITERADQV